MKTLILTFPALQQLIRYGVVGILNNLLGYVLYLLLTFYGLAPKIAITILYPIGMTITYFSHSTFSFSYQGRKLGSVLRYALTYFIAYGMNFMMLLILSDKLMFPHQAVQASAIFVVSGIVFLMLKYFVFLPSPEVHN